MQRPKTILWAALSANGNYARSTAAHPPPREALADFGRETGAHGNFIVGRATFQRFMEQQRANPGAEPGPRADIVVLSNTLDLPAGAPAVVARSPRAALETVAARGHSTAVIVGGTRVHNTFLAENLVDEVVFVINPVFEDVGDKLLLAQSQRRDAKLLEHVELGNGVLRLRYTLGPQASW